jgi:hypothetical protein
MALKARHNPHSQNTQIKHRVVGGTVRKCITSAFHKLHLDEKVFVYAGGGPTCEEARCMSGLKCLLPD